MPRTGRLWITMLTFVTGLALARPAAWAQPRQPNIIMIMGDDIRWFNIGAYNEMAKYAQTFPEFPRCRRAPASIFSS